MYKSEREKEMIKREEDMIKVIYKMEKDFLSNPTQGGAHGLIREWGELKCFRYFSELSKKMDRIDPLSNFLDADKYFFHFRREKKRREALSLLRSLRHDD